MTRRTFILIGAAILAAGVIGYNLHSGAPHTANYVASSLRTPFHRPGCKWAQKIAPENLQTYSTRQAAIDAGHVPCKVCRP